MSLTLTADSSYVDHGVSGLETGDAGAVALWLFPTDDTARQNMTQGVSTERSLLAWDAHAAGDNFRAECQRATTYLTVTAAAANFALYGLNKWLYMAFRWNSLGAAADQQLLIGDRFKKAAEPSAYATQSAGSGALATGATSYRVGSGIVTTREFKGHIAAVCLWNTYPTLEEIWARQRCWNVGPGPGIIVNSIYGRWSGVGQQRDWSGQRNHGTPVAAVTLGPPAPFTIYVPQIQVLEAPAGGAPATSDVAAVYGLGRLSGTMAKGSSGTDAVDALSRLSATGIKNAVGAVSVDSLARLAASGSKAGSGAGALQSIARMSLAAVKASTNTALQRALGREALTAAKGSSGVAGQDTAGVLRVTGAKGSTAAAFERVLGRMFASSTPTTSDTASLLAHGYMTVQANKSGFAQAPVSSASAFFTVAAVRGALGSALLQGAGRVSAVGVKGGLGASALRGLGVEIGAGARASAGAAVLRGFGRLSNTGSASFPGSSVGYYYQRFIIGGRR